MLSNGGAPNGSVLGENNGFSRAGALCSGVVTKGSDKSRQPARSRCVPCSAADVTWLERPKAQIPREPQRSRERKEHERKADCQYQRRQLDARPRLVRGGRDHPDDGSADRHHLAKDEIEHIRPDPKLRLLAP